MKLRVKSPGLNIVTKDQSGKMRRMGVGDVFAVKGKTFPAKWDGKVEEVRAPRKPRVAVTNPAGATPEPTGD
jgi:hypothetical protein